MPTPRRLLCALPLAALACAGGTRPSATPAASPPAPSPAAATAAPGALSRFAATRMVVLPLQTVQGGEGAEWGGGGRAVAALRAVADSALETALGDRGLAAQWIFPPALQRAARRNPTYVTDPYLVRASDVVARALRRRDEPIGEPFASQLRVLTGVSDARYALVPLELRFQPPSAAAAARASLTLAIIDSRGAQLVWTGSVATDGTSAEVAPLVESIAQRVGDLVVAR